MGSCRGDGIWKKHFIPELLAWAGTQEDLFNVSDGIHTEVAHIWGYLYPSITLSDDVAISLTSMVKWSLKHS